MDEKLFGKKLKDLQITKSNKLEEGVIESSYIKDSEGSSVLITTFDLSKLENYKNDKDFSRLIDTHIENAITPEDIINGKVRKISYDTSYLGEVYKMVNELENKDFTVDYKLFNAILPNKQEIGLMHITDILYLVMGFILPFTNDDMKIKYNKSLETCTPLINAIIEDEDARRIALGLLEAKGNCRVIPFEEMQSRQPGDDIIGFEAIDEYLEENLPGYDLPGILMYIASNNTGTYSFVAKIQQSEIMDKFINLWNSRIDDIAETHNLNLNTIEKPDMNDYESFIKNIHKNIMIDNPGEQMKITMEIIGSLMNNFTPNMASNTIFSIVFRQKMGNFNEVFDKQLNDSFNHSINDVMEAKKELDKKHDELDNSLNDIKNHIKEMEEASINRVLQDSSIYKLINIFTDINLDAAIQLLKNVNSKIKERLDEENYKKVQEKVIKSALRYTDSKALEEIQNKFISSYVNRLVTICLNDLEKGVDRDELSMRECKVEFDSTYLQSILESVSGRILINNKLFKNLNIVDVFDKTVNACCCMNNIISNEAFEKCGINNRQEFENRINNVEEIEAEYAENDNSKRALYKYNELKIIMTSVYMTAMSYFAIINNDENGIPTFDEESLDILESVNNEAFEIAKDYMRLLDFDDNINKQQ